VKLNAGPVRVYPQWRDAWVGAYLAPGQIVYLCPVPFCVVRVDLRAAAAQVARLVLAGAGALCPQED
jgi:hypothetical protein